METPRTRIDRLLAPSAIAIVGASERPGPGRQVIENLEQVGYDGTILPINPKYETVFGHRCYPTVAEANSEVDGIDAVAILLGRDRVLPTLKEAGEAGVAGAWAFASGFSESGPEGRALQDRLAAICRGQGIAFCGPNCVGFVNPLARAAAFSAPISPSLRCGEVAAVAQSGSIAMALINSARGLGFRAVVSSGNEAVLDITDYIEYFLDDPETRVVAAFIEQLRRPQRFLEVAEKARAAGKPLIVLKVGRSKIAQRATIAHTGALAGEDAVYDAAFRKHGILRVEDLDEMLETAEAFVRLGADLPKGPHVGMLTVSGGEISLIGDVAEATSLRFPAWSEETRRAFAAVLPEYAEIANPLDAWGSGRIEETYAACVDAAAADDGIDLVMISQDGPRGLAETQVEQFAIVARAAAEARRRTGKPIVAFSHLAGGLDPDLSELFASGGVPFLQGTRAGLRAVHHVIAYAAARRTAAPLHRAPEPGAAERLLGDRTGVLDEVASKEVLRAYGIPCVAETLCSTAEEASQVAVAFEGPVALKVVSAALPHKTDAGGVALGVAGDDVRRAYAEIVDRAAARVGRDAITGVVVQEMVTDAVAEVIVGVAVDPAFGPVVVFGLGGIAVELFADRALGLPPLSREEARSMIGRTKASELLEGFRGAPAGDVDALEDVLVRVGRLAVSLGDRVRSVDINPILVRPRGRGVVAVDGLIEMD